MAGPQRLLHRPRSCVSTPLVSARAVRGELRLRAERDATGKTVLADRHAAGAFHLSKPYWDGHALMVQWINPTAGIFAGDVLTSEVSVGRDAALLVTTPSATRIHARADPSTAPGRQTQRFEVANNGFLEVLPEWLIPQAGSAFEQVTTIHLEERASLFYAELMAPGRVARGEALAFESLDLRIKLRRQGRMLVQERLSVGQGTLWKLRDAEENPLFVASMVAVASGVREAFLREPLGKVASELGCGAGASFIDDRTLCIRATSTSTMHLKKLCHSLRALMMPCLPGLRADTRKL